MILAVALPLAATMTYVWWQALQDGRAREVALLQARLSQVERDLLALWDQSEFVMSRMTRRPAFRGLNPAACDDEMAVIERVLADFAADGVSFHALRGRRAGSKRHVDLHMVVPPDTTVRHGHTMSGQVKGAVRTALPNVEVLIHLEDH